MASTCVSEGKGHTSVTLNQKPEVTRLSEEGVSKADRGQEVGLLCQTAESCEFKGKVLKLKVPLQCTQECKKATQPQC